MPIRVQTVYCLAICSFFGLAVEAQAGMPSYTLDSLAKARLETISFFLLTFFLLGFMVKGLWNAFRDVLPSLPRFKYKHALALLLLSGLLINVILTMISGARELMTPGAWEKQGTTYRLRPVGSGQSLNAEQRKAAITALKDKLWAYAETHNGKTPANMFDGEIAVEAWRFPPGGYYAYLPWVPIGGGRRIVIYEPNNAGFRRFVVMSDGSIVDLSETEITQHLMLTDPNEK